MRYFSLRHQSSVTCLCAGLLWSATDLPLIVTVDGKSQIQHIDCFIWPHCAPLGLEIPPMRTAVGGGGNPQQSGAFVVSYDTKTTPAYITKCGRPLRVVCPFPNRWQDYSEAALTRCLRRRIKRRVVVMWASCMGIWWLAWFVSGFHKQRGCRRFDPPPSRGTFLAIVAVVMAVRGQKWPKAVDTTISCRLLHG